MNVLRKLCAATAVMMFSSLVYAQDGLSFAQLCDSMLHKNIDILTAEEEYARSLLDVKDATAGLGPTVDIQLTGTYMLNPPIGDIIINVDDIANALSGSTVPASSTGQYITLYEGMENTLYNFSVNIKQPIFTWGKITNSIKIYSQIASLKQLQLENKQKQLSTELETRLASMYYLQQIMDILDEEKEYVDRLVAYSEDAEQSGMLLHQDVLEARIRAKELDIAKRNLQEEVANQMLEISSLTGIDDLSWNDIDYVLDESVVEQMMSSDRSLVLEQAVSGERDAIKMLSQLQLIRETATEIAKGYENWKPDFGLQVSAGYGGSRVPLLESNWLRKDDYSLNITVAIQTTIWDGGKKLNDVARKKSEETSASITMDDTVLSIKHNLQSQWNTVDVCTMRMEYEDLKIETIQSKIDQKTIVFQSGYGSESDLLSAKIELCNERIEKIKQALNRTVACFTIRYLVGL